LTPEHFQRSLAEPVEVMYCVGGLYGNTVAAQAIEARFRSEPAERKILILNGDYHWFDLHEEQFVQIEAFARRHKALRGNVETELASLDDSAGCGCAYPSAVSDEDVERSNSILGQLRITARKLGIAQQLEGLPCAGQVNVGQQTIAITHGDHRSLAGWSLAHDAFDQTLECDLGSWLSARSFTGLCSSHTCLPVAGMQENTESFAINNGSAGMSNFSGDTRGLITRISTLDKALPASSSDLLYAATTRQLQVAAVAVEFDLGAWLTQFEKQWSRTSAAYVSYYNRITLGPKYQPWQAIRRGFSSVISASAA
jgi:hypothetical protein